MNGPQNVALTPGAPARVLYKILRWKRFHSVRSCNRINAPDGDKELPRSKRIKQLLGARRKNTDTYFQ
jgi:hypothetical protein